MKVKDERYIYYRDVLEYLRIILGKTKMTKKKEKLIKEKYDRLENLYQTEIEKQINRFRRGESK